MAHDGKVPAFVFRAAKPVRFVVVGGINTVVWYGLYVAMVYAGVHYNGALVAEWAGGIVAGFFLHRTWTFRAHGAGRESFIKYCMTYGVVFAANAGLLNFFVGSAWLGPIAGQGAALGVVVAVSFALQNYWVFGGDTGRGR